MSFRRFSSISKATIINSLKAEFRTKPIPPHRKNPIATGIVVIKRSNPQILNVTIAKKIEMIKLSQAIKSKYDEIVLKEGYFFSILESLVLFDEVIISETEIESDFSPFFATFDISKPQSQTTTSSS